MIPKSKDFEYMDKFKGILKVIESKDYISFDEILGFHIKEVHYKMRDLCPATCNQEEYCGIMRSFFIFATKIVEKLRLMDGLWSLIEDPFVVGSLKEGTRLFSLGKFKSTLFISTLQSIHKTCY